MKVLLIKCDYPKVTLSFKGIVNFEPLNLEYIGAYLSNNYDVEILDMTIEKDYKKKLKNFQPDVVGISCSTVHTFQTHQIAQHIRKLSPKTLIVIGGDMPTVMPTCFNRDYFDVIVIGDGIYTMKEILNNYEQKKPFENIPGIALPKEGRIIFTSRRKHIQNLDLLPFPNRDLTKKYRKNYHFYFRKPVSSIETSRGCLYKCNFCSLWEKTNGTYITRCPELVVDELSTIKEESVFFVDNNPFLDVKRMEKIYRLIKEKGIKKNYICFCSADIIARYPEIIEKWAEIGLSEVSIGFESFRIKDLQTIDKRTTIDMNNRAVKILRQNKIDILVSFIIYPDYEEKDFKALFEYIEKNDLYYVQLLPLTPLPGTNLYKERYNDIISYNYELCDLQHVLLPTKLSLKKIYSLLTKSYFQIYFYTRTRKVRLNYPISYNPFHPVTIAFWRFLYALQKAHKAYSDKIIPFVLPK